MKLEASVVQHLWDYSSEDEVFCRKFFEALGESNIGALDQTPGRWILDFGFCRSATFLIGESIRFYIHFHVYDDEVTIRVVEKEIIEPSGQLTVKHLWCENENPNS